MVEVDGYQGRIVDSEGTLSPFRVVEVTRLGNRRVLWVDERPEARRMLREMHVDPTR